MTNETPRQDDIRTRRIVQLLVFAVIGIAFVGFVVGLDDGAPHRQWVQTAEPANGQPHGQAMDAVAYAELVNTRLGPNRDWRSDFRTLAGSAAPAPPLAIDPDAKRASLELRSERRAYNGAPPMIPHAVDAISSAQCMSCHSDSLRIGQQRPADRPSHPYMTNCQQCHASAQATPFDAFEMTESTFVGMPAPFEGERAWLGAPPTIPHSTFMRTDCLSCHGVNGKPGLRTTHPERLNCLQCHGVSAVLDQGIVGKGASFLSPAQILQR